MKDRIMRGLLCLLLLCSLLAGCGSERTPPSGEEPAGEATTAPTEAMTEAMTEAAPIEAIPGVGAENYPRVDGSTANMPLMARIYSEICGVPVEDAETMIYASGGTGAVWMNMLWEGADLLLVYEMPDPVREQFEEEGLLDQLEITPIGRDGLVFLANQSNPLDSLTTEQLIAVYSGEVTDWGELGGTPGPIAAYQRNEDSGSQTLFQKLVMKDITPMTPPTELVQAGMGGLIESVADYDGAGGAIGYSVYHYASLMYANPALKLLAVDGVAPTAESIADGTYPLTNDFYVVIRKDAAEGSPERLLRDWIVSDAGRAVMTEESYIPLG